MHKSLETCWFVRLSIVTGGLATVVRFSLVFLNLKHELVALRMKLLLEIAPTTMEGEHYLNQCVCRMDFIDYV